MPELILVGMELVHPNPRRHIDRYPFVKRKINALMRSIKDVGFWEGVIGRPNPDGKGYQIAFGHHRVEAAKRAGLNRMPLIVRDLTDEQMIQFMGRENGEDYSADMDIMLNTWEGGIEHFEEKWPGQPVQDVEVAKLLGWTILHKKSGRSDTIEMNDVGRACANSHKLIHEGIIDHTTVKDVPVKTARNLALETKKQIKQVEDGLATDVVKKKAIKGIKKVASDAADAARSGNLASKQVRKVIKDGARSARAKAAGQRETPDYAQVVIDQSRNLQKSFMGHDERRGRVKQIIAAIPHLQRNKDILAVSNLADDFENAANRMLKMAARIRAALDKPKTATVTPLKQIGAA